MANISKGVKGFVSVPLAIRFCQYVDRRGPEECWLWLGTKTSNTSQRAYGRIYVAGKSRPAHQIAWELHHGEPFPSGMDGCHSCDNPSCVNPRHIFPGTAKDNAQDALRKGRLVSHRKDICMHGHALTPENTYLENRGTRSCKQCRVRINQAWRQRKKAARRALLDNPAEPGA